MECPLEGLPPTVMKYGCKKGLKSYTMRSKMRSLSKKKICDSIVSIEDKITPGMIENPL